MSNYHTPGGSNLNGNPHAPRMGAAQAREFESHINPNRDVPAWMLKLVAEQQTEPEVREVLDEYLQAEEQKQQEEAEAEYVAEYHAWALEVAQAEIGG